MLSFLTSASAPPPTKCDSTNSTTPQVTPGETSTGLQTIPHPILHLHTQATAHAGKQPTTPTQPPCPPAGEALKGGGAATSSTLKTNQRAIAPPATPPAPQSPEQRATTAHVCTASGSKRSLSEMRAQPLTATQHPHTPSQTAPGRERGQEPESGGACARQQRQEPSEKERKSAKQCLAQVRLDELQHRRNKEVEEAAAAALSRKGQLSLSEIRALQLSGQQGQAGVSGAVLGGTPKSSNKARAAQGNGKAASSRAPAGAGSRNISSFFTK